MPENGRNGIVGATADLGKQLIGVLPPAFLMLVALNLVFLGLIMWFLNSQLDVRIQLLAKILDKCLDK